MNGAFLISPWEKTTLLRVRGGHELNDPKKQVVTSKSFGPNLNTPWQRENLYMTRALLLPCSL